MLVILPTELMHHLVFVLTLGSTGAWYDWGLLSNYLAFFMCGLPGGIEYVLLAYKRLGRCSDATVRHASMWLNVGMRQPAVLLGLGAGVPAVHAGRCGVPLWAVALHYALGCVNVCYYAAGAVVRAAQHERARQHT